MDPVCSIDLAKHLWNVPQAWEYPLAMSERGNRPVFLLPKSFRTGHFCPTAMKGNFLPITREEMKERGWDQVDFVYVSGDAYVDHPSFGHAIITRLLESRGYRVGIIAQPDWRKPESVQVFGEPRLGFLVSAGNMDSMVNHYSVSKKRR